tara:strand:- start:848 stop:1378 length:531 start_codon:yes stop_codon:yes gene_type:complete
VKDQSSWGDELQKLENGNTSSFSDFARKVAPSLLRYSFRILNDRFEAEDVVQEVMVKIYFRHSSYRKESSAKTWIYKITRNSCLDRLRKFSPESMDTVDLNELYEDEFIQFAKSDELSEILKLAEHLNHSEKEVLYLRHLDGLEFDQIASITSEGLSAVKMRYKRSVDKLKEIYSE